MKSKADQVPEISFVLYAAGVCFARDYIKGVIDKACKEFRARRAYLSLLDGVVANRNLVIFAAIKICANFRNSTKMCTYCGEHKIWMTRYFNGSICIRGLCAK